MRDWKEEHMKMVLDGEGAYRISLSDLTASLANVICSGNFARACLKRLRGGINSGEDMQHQLYSTLLTSMYLHAHAVCLIQWGCVVWVHGR
jgi:hypothetical protein